VLKFLQIQNYCNPQKKLPLDKNRLIRYLAFITSLKSVVLQKNGQKKPKNIMSESGKLENGSRI
jgi:hypothetical protein